MLCLAAALSSEAQNNSYYHLILKGQPSPFDTAVAVRIDRYRLESLTMKAHRELIDSLVAEILSLHVELSLAYQSNAYDSAIMTRMDARSARQDSTIHIMNESIKQIVKKVDAIPVKTFWNDWHSYAIATSLALLIIKLLF